MYNFHTLIRSLEKRIILTDLYLCEALVEALGKAEDEIESLKVELENERDHIADLQAQNIVLTEDKAALLQEKEVFTAEIERIALKDLHIQDLERDMMELKLLYQDTQNNNDAYQQELIEVHEKLELHEQMYNVAETGKLESQSELYRKVVRVLKGLDVTFCHNFEFEAAEVLKNYWFHFEIFQDGDLRF